MARGPAASWLLVDSPVAAVDHLPLRETFAVVTGSKSFLQKLARKTCAISRHIRRPDDHCPG
jgi:hypothetical protein